MRLRALLSLIALGAAAHPLLAQARANWSDFGGDAQHSGWERTDPFLSTETVKNLQLLWKWKAEPAPKGPRPLQPPALLGNLISYRGFKELAFVGASSGIVYAIDADLGTLFWQKHLEYANLDAPSNGSSWACPGGLTAMPAMPPPAPRGGGPGRAGPARAANTPAPARGPFTPVGVASVYVISSDGRLHRLNTSTGDDVAQPMGVLPANARIQALTIDRNVIYTVTSQGCNDAPNAVWAVDLTVDPPKAATFALRDEDALGLGGVTVGMDGTVYAQTSDRLLTLNGKDLELKHSFSTGSASATKDPDLNSVAPLVFPYKDGEMIVTLGRDSRLHVLSADAPDTSLYDSPPVSNGAGGVWGGLSTWQEMDGTRWILAPVWGGVNPDLKLAGAISAPSGSIVAFKLDDANGAPVLTPVWISRDLNSPEPPAMVNGVVFALSSGEFSRSANRAGERAGERVGAIDERAKSGTRAVLYALDAATGKELYSSRSLVNGSAAINGPAALTGMTLANGRVYFGAMDGTVYCFGIYQEH